MSFALLLQKFYTYFEKLLEEMNSKNELSMTKEGKNLYLSNLFKFQKWNSNFMISNVILTEEWNAKSFLQHYIFCTSSNEYNYYIDTHYLYTWERNTHNKNRQLGLKKCHIKKNKNSKVIYIGQNCYIKYNICLFFQEIW